MKSLILLVLAVVATQAAVIDPAGTFKYHYPDAAEIEASKSRQRRDAPGLNINVGSTDGNRLLYSPLVLRDGVSGQIQRVTATYRTNSDVKIYAVQAIQLSSQDASARIIAGGVGENYVTIRMESAANNGFNYQLKFWGR